MTPRADAPGAPMPRLRYAGLRRLPAGVAGVLTPLRPAGVAVTAAAVLGERFGAVRAVAFAPMVSSLLPATWSARGRRG